MIGEFGVNIARFVEAFDPGAVQLFNVAARDLIATIGRMLKPAMEAATKIVKIWGDAIAGTSENTNKLVSALVVTGTVITATAALVMALRLAMVAATGGVLGIVQVLAGALVASTVFSAVMDKTGQIMEAFGAVIEIVMDVIDTGLGSVAGIIEIMMPAITAFVRVLALVAKVFTEIYTTGITIILELLTPLLEALANVLLKVAETVVEILSELGIEISRSRKGASTGMAAHQANFTSASSYAQQAYASAYGLGTDVKLEEAKKTNNFLADLIALGNKIYDEVANFVKTMTGEKAKEGFDAGRRGDIEGAPELSFDNILNGSLPGYVGGLHAAAFDKGREWLGI